MNNKDNEQYQSRMRGYLQLVATGPELSKSLNLEQAEDALAMILNGKIDAVRSGIFLIALRMKRESDAENIGALNALNQALETTSIRAPDVLSISDPFNGYLRGIPVTAFLPAVLASCGLPSYTHGLQAVGPKYGVTSHMILKAAGKSVDHSVTEASERLDNREIGWAYIDQKQMIPSLHDLVDLRDVMVKRTYLSTLEVVLRPISGGRRSHLMTGFVHKAYPPVYARLAQHAGFDSAMIIRGVEGGCIPSLSQVSRYFGYRDHGEIELNKLTPSELGIDQAQRMVPIPEVFEPLMEQTRYQQTDVLKPVIQYAVELGMRALDNHPGPTLDILIYGAAIALSHTRISGSLEQGATMARRAIASGEALHRFKAA